LANIVGTPKPHSDADLTWDWTACTIHDHGGGDHTQVGMAMHVHLVTASRSMNIFFSADSELLVAL
jgi:homogentisate 1,2-dioxygenase